MVTDNRYEKGHTIVNDKAKRQWRIGFRIVSRGFYDYSSIDDALEAAIMHRPQQFQ